MEQTFLSALNPRAGAFLPSERIRIRSGGQECPPLTNSMAGKNACPTFETGKNACPTFETGKNACPTFETGKNACPTQPLIAVATLTTLTAPHGIF